MLQPNGSHHRRVTPGSDRWGFTAFPPLQTERAIFTALRFPVGSKYCETEDEEQAPGSRADETRFISIPSFFLNPYVSVRSTYPGEPLPCPSHYRTAFGSYVASALSALCWHSRTPLAWVKACESSRIPILTVLASRSCLLYAGWDNEAIHTCVGNQGDTHRTVLVRAYQPVSPFRVNDASDTGFFRQHRRQGWLPFRWTGSQIGFVVSGLPTPNCATIRRRPLSLLVIAQTRFSMNNSQNR